MPDEGPRDAAAYRYEHLGLAGTSRTVPDDELPPLPFNRIDRAESTESFEMSTFSDDDVVADSSGFSFGVSPSFCPPAAAPAASLDVIDDRVCSNRGVEICCASPCPFCIKTVGDLSMVTPELPPPPPPTGRVEFVPAHRKEGGRPCGSSTASTLADASTLPHSTWLCRRAVSSPETRHSSTVPPFSECVPASETSFNLDVANVVVITFLALLDVVAAVTGNDDDNDDDDDDDDDKEDDALGYSIDAIGRRLLFVRVARETLIPLCSVLSDPTSFPVDSSLSKR